LFKFPHRYTSTDFHYHISTRRTRHKKRFPEKEHQKSSEHCDRWNDESQRIAVSHSKALHVLPKKWTGKLSNQISELYEHDLQGKVELELTRLLREFVLIGTESVEIRLHAARTKNRYQEAKKRQEPGIVEIVNDSVLRLTVEVLTLEDSKLQLLRH
jgi:hypothetical protein